MRSVEFASQTANSDKSLKQLPADEGGIADTVRESVHSRTASFDATRVALAERLRARCPELTASILAQIKGSLAGAQIDGMDAEYVAGAHAAVRAVLDYELAGIECGDADCNPIPTEAVMQAHRAARSRVALDTVLLRCNAANCVLSDVILAEADRFSSGALREVLAERRSAFERLLASIAEEYRREAERIGRSTEDARVELVRRLLAGAPIDGARLGYRFDASHLGVVATGEQAVNLLRGLAVRLDRRLLMVSRGDTTWAWLGGGCELDASDLERVLPVDAPADVALAVGEPADGRDGWRLTHMQAQATLRVVVCRPRAITRFADVALLAAVLREDTISQSLEAAYTAPLDDESDGGEASRRTLRAYFEADHNVKSAAAALGVDRNTVRNRLDRIERRLGCRLHLRRAELDVALQLHQLRRGTRASGASRT